MELKVKYQTSYFIYPFIIKQEKYQKYILKLLKNKNIEMKLFNKKVDTDLYCYFLPQILRHAFYSFGIYEDQRKELNEMDKKLKAKVISEFPCITFEYKLKKELQAKTGEEKGIFFKIQKIQIICFNTGICFLILKTNVEDTNKFEDILDFNYKFRDINSDVNYLRAIDNIKIQNNTFGDIKKMSELIKEITGNMEETRKVNIDTNRFLIYSYVCLEQEYWSNPEEFNKIEKEFYKYANVLPSNFNSKFDNEKLNIVNLGQYIKIGITKTGVNLMTSSVNTINYTLLPNNHEYQYMYIYILTLYKRIFLKKIMNDYKVSSNMEKISEEFNKFVNELWAIEMTNDDNGNLLQEELEKTLELDKLYEKVKNQYDVQYKRMNVEKNSKSNKILILILILSLGLNIINFILLFKKI